MLQFRVFFCRIPFATKYILSTKVNEEILLFSLH